jgi:hypothetical protein
MDDTRKTPRQDAPRTLGNIADAGAGNLARAGLDTYDQSPVESALELDELVRLRAELTWADWKAHPRFKKDRVLREAQRRWGVSVGEAPVVPALLAGFTAANDVDPDEDPDAALAADPMFATVCDARRDAWIEAMETEASNEEAAESARQAGG